MSDIDCNKKSFAELIRDYNITIPLIQREYAQGRDNEQGQEVRKNFVPNLIEVLTGDEKSLELDFVFGVKKSAEANNEILIPLDGQQRLTTLLLLHWYFGAHRKNWAFTYKSRRMANSFVNGLLNATSYDRKTPPSKWIKNQKWFFENWLTDPTVSGMLTMLDAIHNKVTDSCDPAKLDNITAKLDNIIFYLYPIDQLDADNAYTKMNARGEPLTAWENLKALLDKKEQDLCLADKLLSCDHPNCCLTNKTVSCKQSNCCLFQWIENIDGNWLFTLEQYAELNYQNYESILKDLNNLKAMGDNEQNKKAFEEKEKAFEETLDGDVKKINCAFRNIFDLAVCIDLAKQINEPPSNEDKNNEKISSIQNQISSFHEHKTLLSDYAECVNRRIFDIATDLFQTLLLFDSYDLKKWWDENLCIWESKEKKSFTDAFLFNEKYSFVDCVRFYSICRFGNERTGDWLRIIRNILENGPKIDKNNFADAISLIEELSGHPEGILTFLAAKENDIQSTFATEQVKEELLKARMIWNDHNVYNIIKEAECEIHFKGRIISLLPKAINSENKYKDLTFEDIVSDADLRKRFNKFVNFIKEKEEKKEKPYPELGRELLKYGDYTLWSNGNNWQFVVSKESLTEMLHNKSERFYTKFIPAWIKFLDDNENTKGCAYEPTHWQYYFIKYTSILDKSSEKHGVFSWEGDFSCQLLANTTKHGYRCSPYVMAALFEPNEQHPAPWTNDSGDYYHIPNSETAVRIFQRDHIGLEIKTGENITRIQWDPKKDKDFVEFIRECLKNTWQTL